MCEACLNDAKRALEALPPRERELIEMLIAHRVLDAVDEYDQSYVPDVDLADGMLDRARDVVRDIEAPFSALTLHDTTLRDFQFDIHEAAWNRARELLNELRAQLEMEDDD